MHLYSGSLVFCFWGPLNSDLPKNSGGLYCLKNYSIVQPQDVAVEDWSCTHWDAVGHVCLSCGIKIMDFLVQFHLLSYIFFQTPPVAPESLPDTGTGYAGTSSPTQPLGVCVELKSASRSPLSTGRFFLWGLWGPLLYLPQGNYSPIWELPNTLNLREPESLDLDKNEPTLLPELSILKDPQRCYLFQATIGFYYGPSPMVMNLHSPFPHLLNKKGALKGSLSQWWKFVSRLFDVFICEQRSHWNFKILPHQVSKVLHK